MRQLSIGRSIVAMAAVGFLTIAPPSRNVAIRASEPRVSNQRRRERGKNKKGPAPNGLTAQRFDKSRLIVDRASSFKRLRRWARSKPELIEQPSTTAKMRHQWFRDLVAKQAA